MRPIWKDFIQDIFWHGDSAHFYVIEDGNTDILYEGRVDKLPGESLYIHANKVCETLLDMYFPETTGVTQHPEAAKSFIFLDADLDYHVSILDADFINDWSYEDVEYEKTIMSQPINGHLDPRMKLFITTYNASANKLIVNV